MWTELKPMGVFYNLYLLSFNDTLFISFEVNNEPF